jgi:AraC-like DNA-binding protein
MQDKTEGYNTGADSYITKPFSAGLLHSRVKNLLESRKKLASTFTSSPLQKQTIVTESLHQLDQEFLEKIIAIVEENLSSENINISFIASQLNMSNSTFYRKIKALTNQSPNEFIRKIKMHHAEKLLLTGKYTISEIIFHVGINSSAYFRQCFKDEFGLTPTDYLKQFKK